MVSKSQRHPLVVLSACWLAVGLLFVSADCALKPTPNPTPALAPRVTVLPTVYVFTATATATVTPIEAVLLPTRTPGPSVTRTPMLTWTPLPEVTRVPVQKG